MESDVCRELYASLSNFVKVSYDMFYNFEEKAKEKLPDVGYKKIRYRRRHINSDALENLEPRDEFKIKTFTLDALVSSLVQRSLV